MTENQKANKRTIDWNFYSNKCPVCKSKNSEKMNQFKREWVHKKSERWELKERQLIKCKDCGNTWWI